jgi:GTP-binding protein
MAMPAVERIAAIVGRPNVGKSALFNRLAGRQISIVHDQPGVTRDRITAECKLGTAPFTIIDTGGIGAVADVEFSVQVRQEADIAMASAHVIMLVVDGVAGLQPVDQELAKVLRKSKKPIITVVNKIDHDGRSSHSAEFTKLGFGEPLETSAAHGRGFAELVEKIEEHLPAPSGDGTEEPAARPFRVAIVGRPNVGKSSLINAILSDARTLVSDVAGTTRDAVDVPYQRGSKHYALIDTAGIRPRGRHKTSVEVFSVMRSEKSINRADLCVLVVDAGQGVTTQDKKIAGLIQEAKKPCVIVMNKWDIIDPGADRTDVLKEVFDQIREELFFLPYAPVVVASAKRGTHMARLFNTIEKVRKACETRIGTGPLNRLVAKTVELHAPPMRKGRRLKILYAAQVLPREGTRERHGAMRIVLFVNNPTLIDHSYLRYMENAIRAEWECTGVPILLQMRGREIRSESQKKG